MEETQYKIDIFHSYSSPIFIYAFDFLKEPGTDLVFETLFPMRSKLTVLPAMVLFWKVRIMGAGVSLPRFPFRQVGRSSQLLHEPPGGQPSSVSPLMGTA